MKTVEKRKQFYKSVVGILVSFVFIYICASFAIFAQQEEPFVLSEVEKKWMKAHGVITYGADNDFAPFESIDESGELVGIDMEFLSLIESKLGVAFNKTSGKWSDILGMLPRGKVDVISAIYTEERKVTMAFTTAYMEVPSAIIVRKDNNEIRKPDDLEISGVKIATVEGWSWNDELPRNYPNAMIIPYPDLLTAFNAVAFGEVDTIVIDVATAGSVIENNKITTLKMVAEYPTKTTLHFAVRRGDPILLGILQKAIDSISKEEIKSIYDKWVKPVTVPFYETNEFKVTVGVLGILLISMATWTASLSAEVKRRTEDLRSTNEELEEIIAEMNGMERKLIEQEKMAALGGMVAGITHEVNAPLGIMFTGISVMEEHLEWAKKAFEENRLKKSDLVTFFNDMEQHTVMLNGSVKSAIDLLNSMKTMSVDQMAEQKETFELCAYLEKIRSNLRYECKKRGASFTLECDGPLEMDSYPGAFSQIITNLVFNSLIHGFENRTGGNIKLSTRIHGSMLEMIYEDDGIGVTKETITQMFEAFFTSKRKSGGSGLGMHIIKTLVEDRLKGTIVCESEFGLWIRFTIQIPVEH